MPACTFFGHRTVTGKVYDVLYKEIETLIRECGVDSFYVGNNGDFDIEVRRALRELKKEYPAINYSVVLAYPPRDDGYDYSDTIYPEGIETVPKRYAILWRNEWMLKKSEYVIGYIDHPFGGAYKFFEKAKKQKKKVKNIAQTVEKGMRPQAEK